MDSQVISRFKQLVKAGLIEEGLREYGKHWNIRGTVINAGIFWVVIASCQGWCIQQRTGPIHGPYDHFRILDPNDKRLVWGGEANISQCIMSIPLASVNPVFSCFDELVDSGKIRSRLKEQASTNVEWETLGGSVFWNTLHEYKGWRIQQHKWFHNCRILDPDDIRCAWGSQDYVYRRIQGHPINILTNYLRIPRDCDNSFIKYSSQDFRHKGSVVLIHGWGCRAINMEEPAKSLAGFGYDAYCYDYQSALYSIPELGEKLLCNLKYLLKQLPAKEKLYILTHSMGGLILRKALELDTGDDSIGGRISQIVMLGPPNQGSLMADLAVLAGVGVVNKSINDMRYLGEAAVKEIGKPAHFNKPIGIIAGRWDLKVLPQDSVNIPGMTEGIDYKMTKVDASHPKLRTSFDALSQAIVFFETGDFSTKP